MVDLKSNTTYESQELLWKSKPLIQGHSYWVSSKYTRFLFSWLIKFPYYHQSFLSSTDFQIQSCKNLTVLLPIRSHPQSLVWQISPQSSPTPNKAAWPPNPPQSPELDATLPGGRSHQQIISLFSFSLLYIIPIAQLKTHERNILFSVKFSQKPFLGRLSIFSLRWDH